VSVPDFLKKIESLDEEYAQKVAEAAAKGEVLRYAASITPSAPAAVTVGLLSVPKASPLGSLQGTDNLVLVNSGWYPNRDAPLVVRGAGAGLNVTAAGVLGDVMELCGCR
jgi:homoserine dehydrogenase